MRWLAAIVIALLGVPAASARAAPHVCTLLTDRQVAHALAQKVQYHQGATGSCTWHMQPLSKYTSAAAEVFVQVAPATKARFRRQENANFGAVPVRGVGEIAYWIPSSQVRELMTWHAGYAVSVYVIEVTNQLRPEKTLTSLILARLG